MTDIFVQVGNSEPQDLADALKFGGYDAELTGDPFFPVRVIIADGVYTRPVKNHVLGVDPKAQFMVDGQEAGV